ncbi:RNA polymerase sigma factor [Pyxidicoccus xibeiensis]|uniref:RNA polymerase sigma factor n=1 Tax=Pyxidicoccus xibeiensis TaxID=2906759 RepID=UPI0020A6E44E|nr:sigma factor [Pyxidicoccus xibeiensis]MCP3144102.1 sigma-70 family RNA polymerase sigma factor [Pyxidicoccus xibeiensis]
MRASTRAAIPPGEREVLEQRIRHACARGEVGEAVALALEGYGPEIHRLLESILRDLDRARDAYCDFSESLLRDLPAFRWESSFRTWAYCVARNVAYRLAASSSRRDGQESLRVVEELPHAERSRTNPWLRSSVKERFRGLREQLAPHERTILELRVDLRLSWLDIARRLAPPGGPPTPEALHRKSAVLRQQFRSLKQRLRELADEERLLSTG